MAECDPAERSSKASAVVVARSNSPVSGFIVRGQCVEECTARQAGLDHQRAAAQSGTATLRRDMPASSATPELVCVCQFVAARVFHVLSRHSRVVNRHAQCLPQRVKLANLSAFFALMRVRLDAERAERQSK